MTAIAELSSVQTKRALRDPATVFFMLALGPMLVIVMGLIFGTDHCAAFGPRLCRR